MTQDEIIEMWNSVIKYARGEVRITEFAKLVAAKEQKKWQDQTAVEIHEAILEERERIYKAKECCILCEQKGVCNENTKDDETNTAKILGKS